MGASSLRHVQTGLIFLLQFSTLWCSCLATKPIPKTNFIKISCDNTLYPLLCYKSLSKYANKIQTSPKLLANTSLSVALSATRSTSLMMKNLSKTQGLKPREKAAMLDCVEEVSDSVYQLHKSTKEMHKANSGDSNFEFLMSNIQTWTSAALTDDDTCLDGFSGKTMNGQIKTLVRSRVLKIVHLTSIALAFVNNYAAS